MYRYTKEGNNNELRHKSMYGYENNRNSLVYWYTRTAPQLLCSLCHFYLLDSVCYQYRGAKIKYLRMSAKQCEAENHCYDYKNNKFYDVL